MSKLAMWEPIKTVFAVIVQEQGRTRLIGTYTNKEEAMHAARAYYQANPKGEVALRVRCPSTPIPRRKTKGHTARRG